MKKINPIFLSSLLLLTAVILRGGGGGAAAENLIEEACETSAENDPNVKFNFCTASLRAAPGSHCAGLDGLVRMAIQLLVSNVTDTRCHIKQLLENRTWDDYNLQRLNDCLQLYSDAVPTAKQALKYFNAKRYDDANIYISSAMDSATTCEDGFKERENGTPPLTKRNTNTFQLGALALSLLVQTASSD